MQFPSERIIRVLLLYMIVVLTGTFFTTTVYQKTRSKHVLPAKSVESHWFILHRKSNTEELYKGVPGDRAKSSLSKRFRVKVGIPGERPTPLPQLVGRRYWKIIAEQEEKDNPETAPYFLTLDIPSPPEEPYGPSPYNECNGQCHWVLPGAFGLHGTGGDPSKLSPNDPGSSGCIRHRDEDITYLFNLLDPKKEEIRYYIEDN